MTLHDGKGARALRFAAMAAVCVATSAFATNRLDAQRPGEGPLVLRLPVSARGLSMGNAMTVSTDADVLFANPGMLAQARGFAVSVQRYGSNATVGSAATISTVGIMTLAVGVQHLDWSAPAAGGWSGHVREGAPALADRGGWPATSNAFTLGLARTFKGLRLGGSVKVAEERLGSYDDAVIAFDLGANRPFGPGTLGLAVQNLGTGLHMAGYRGPLPTRAALGWGAGRTIGEQWDIAAQAQLSVEQEWFVRPAAGGELTWSPLEGVAVTVRNGIRLPREGDEPLVTGGLGFTLDRFALDYAFEPMRGGRPVSHRVGLRIR